MPSSFDSLFGQRAETPVPVIPEEQPAPPPPPDVTPADLLQEPFTYLSGPAGTGKTFLARQIIAAGKPGHATLCATTGIAAVNLGDASTINALLRYFNTASLVEHYTSGFLQATLRKLRRSGLKRIVLDEVSMLDADQLTVLVRAMDEINSTSDYDADVEGRDIEDDDRLGLILVGDFAQLPPVKAPFAFESAEWERFAARTFKLTTIRRQSDRVFVDALQTIRRGDARSVVDVFRHLFVPSTDIQYPGTTLVAKNESVDRINHLRHDGIKGTLCTYKTIVSGERHTEWKPPHYPEQVAVKTGSLVMILANARKSMDISDGFLYVNGDLAEVVEQHHPDQPIKVRLQRTGEEVTVEPVTREWKIPTGLKKKPYEVKGAITYMPLRLAYATTVHKSQGLSLDRVQVNIVDHFFGSPGMLYVALSRARTLEGLRIVGTPETFIRRCATDKKIGGWL